jgi:cell division protein FtsL
LRATDRRAWRRNQNTVKFQLGTGLGPISHTIIIAIMLCVLGLIYLTQITKTGAYGYQINDLKVRKDQILSEKRDLEVENARLQALERVKQSDVAKAMTNPASTEYIQ